MNRWSVVLVASVIAACGGGRAPADEPSAARSGASRAEPEPPRSAAPARARASTIAPLATMKGACVVHRAAVVCSQPWISVPEPVEGLALGDGRGCAVASSGSLYCWGRNGEGELGLGRRSEREPPTRMSGLVRVVDVALEYSSRSCAIDAEGSLFCWGMHHDVPTRVATPAPARDVAYCNEAICATLEGGSLRR